jgi:hypothetical protein
MSEVSLDSVCAYAPSFASQILHKLRDGILLDLWSNFIAQMTFIGRFCSKSMLTHCTERAALAENTNPNFLECKNANLERATLPSCNQQTCFHKRSSHPAKLSNKLLLLHAAKKVLCGDVEGGCL